LSFISKVGSCLYSQILTIKNVFPLFYFAKFLVKKICFFNQKNNFLKKKNYFEKKKINLMVKLLKKQVSQIKVLKKNIYVKSKLLFKSPNNYQVKKTSFFI
jgi:hypothetical protein